MAASTDYIPNPGSTAPADAGIVEPEDSPLNTYSHNLTLPERLPAMKYLTWDHKRSHRKYLSILVLSLLFLLLSRCEIWNSGLEGIPITLFSSQDEFETYYKNMPKDKVTITGSRIEDNLLIIEVQYPGGCGNHTFELVASNFIYKTNPPQIAVFLGHDNGNNPCKRGQSETLQFDLQPLRKKWFYVDYDLDVLIIRLNDEPMDDWLTDRSMWLIR